MVAALQNEQARLVALRGGLLGDQLGRQVEIEIGGAHRDSVRFAAKNDNS